MRALLAAAALVSLLAACDSSEPGAAPQQPLPEPVHIGSGAEAVSGAVVATEDPHTMWEAEVAAVVPAAAPQCRFSFTDGGKPVLAVGDTRGVIKLNGVLVPLAPQPGGMAAIRNGTTVSADQLKLVVHPDPGAPEQVGDGTKKQANMIFRVLKAPGWTVGYRGYWRCLPHAPDVSKG